MSQLYVSRQAIVHNRDRFFAYEILYRGENPLNSFDEQLTSASLVSDLLDTFSTKARVGRYKGFIKINYKFLMSNLIYSVPNNLFVFLISDTVEMDEEVVDRVKELSRKGYFLGINTLTLTQETLDKYKKILNELSYVKVDFTHVHNSSIKPLVVTLQEENIRVIACNVDTNAIYSLAESLGCNLFEGDFLSQLHTLQSAKYSAKGFQVLQLYSLLMQDTPINQLTTAFEKHHEVSIQLLRFINSGYFHFRRKISSMKQIITLVGRRPLGEWLILMAYSKAGSMKKSYSPLTLLVKTRTELMQGVLQIMQPNASAQSLGETYFVGVLSLMDVAFSMKLEAILEHLDVSNEVKEALFEQKGIYGEIYSLVKNIESFETEKIADFLKKHNIAKSALDELMFETIESINLFDSSVNE